MTSLRIKAARKPAGYLKSVLAGSEVRGEWVIIPVEHWHSIRWRYGGAGDRLELLLAPIVDWLDRTFGTRLKGCKACRERRDRLNGN